MTQEPHVLSQKELETYISMAKALRSEVMMRLAQRLIRFLANIVKMASFAQHPPHTRG